MKLARLSLAALLTAFLPTSATADVIHGQVQTFDDPHGWVAGVGPVIMTPIPVPIALGGPGGPLDPFLSIVATGGSGPGSRLSAQNFAEWSGNYLAQGISQINMDANNFGPNEVHLRLLFVQFVMNVPVNAAFTTAAVVLNPGTGWGRIAIDISPGALTPLLGSATDALANTTELRIFHNPLPEFNVGNNPPIVATVGIDNISAVPEPATWLLLTVGSALASSKRWRSRRG